MFRSALISLVGFSINWRVYAFITNQVPFLGENRVLAFLLGIGTANVINSVFLIFFERSASDENLQKFDHLGRLLR